MIFHFLIFYFFVYFLCFLVDGTLLAACDRRKNGSPDGF